MQKSAFFKAGSYFLKVIRSQDPIFAIPSVKLYVSPISNHTIPDSKVHGAYMGPTWGRQDPGGPHVGPMNLAIRDTRRSANLCLG